MTHPPSISEKAQLSDGEAKFKHPEIEADKNEVVVSLGNAKVHIYDRLDGNTRKATFFPWERPIRGLHYLCRAPKLLLFDEWLVVAYQHEPLLRIVDRLDYDTVVCEKVLGTEAEVPRGKDGTLWMGLLKLTNGESDQFLLASHTNMEVFEISQNGCGASFQSVLTIPMPNETISSVAVDKGKIYVTSQTPKQIQVLSAQDGSSITTQDLRFRPGIIRVHEHWVFVSNDEGNRQNEQIVPDRYQPFQVYRADDLGTQWFVVQGLSTSKFYYNSQMYYGYIVSSFSQARQESGYVI